MIYHIRVLGPGIDHSIDYATDIKETEPWAQWVEKSQIRPWLDQRFPGWQSIDVDWALDEDIQQDLEATEDILDLDLEKVTISEDIE